jgi:hypothetical protein
MRRSTPPIGLRIAEAGGREVTSLPFIDVRSAGPRLGVGRAGATVWNLGC